MQNPPAEMQESLRVSTIELFFDLVFVFTITQITHLIEHAHEGLDYLLALMVLMLIWWIYAGYAWLTNAVGVERTYRLVLIAAMAGFFVMALAIPGVFEADGLVFGLAYLFVVLVHLGVFVVRGGPGAARSILAIAPFNLGAAALVIAAGVIDAEWEWILWIAAPALFVITTIFRSYQGFSVNSAYFVERHGLIIILALGETVIDIGIGAAGRSLNWQTILLIVLALIFIATLWWSYFDGDDARAEEAMLAATPENRARMALLGYWYTHLIMIFGIVLVATAIKEVVAHSEETASTATWLFATGLAIYLTGDLLLRRIIGIGPVMIRAVAALVALSLGFVGFWWGGIVELAVGTLLMIAIFAVERREAPILHQN